MKEKQMDILIVDDNPINLTVTEGLLEPLKMHIETVTSGKMALDRIAQKRYDIIFMDHMMPELDGVETTRIIRRLHPTFNDVPIIALTANAVDGSKDMFLSEGMNDFIPKPIELKTIVTVIKKWLPNEKIRKGNLAEFDTNNDQEGIGALKIGDLDTTNARKLLGNDKLFFNILKEYYKAIPTKSMLIKELEQSENWQAYTIEVHALKSISRQIGANELADMAADLEHAGNEKNITKIKNETDLMIQKYVGYLDVLKPYCEEQEKKSDKNQATKEKILELFDSMLDAVDNLDMDKMEEVILDMSHFGYPDEQTKYYEQLKIAVGNIDVDRCEDIINNWKTLL